MPRVCGTPAQGIQPGGRGVQGVRLLQDRLALLQQERLELRGPEGHGGEVGVDHGSLVRHRVIRLQRFQRFQRLRYRGSRQLGQRVGLGQQFGVRCRLG